MPTYLYKNIETGEIYELVQSMRDDAYTTHPETGVAVKRILARPGIAFKGSGFYVNDSRAASSEGSSKEKSSGEKPAGAAKSGSGQPGKGSE